MSQPAQAVPKPAGILTVSKARGFAVETSDQLLVITAAHCLPSLPAPFEPTTYPNLLGPLGQTPTISAQCLFVDPVSDLAVLGPPDNQNLWTRAQAYQDLLSSVSPFPVSDAPSAGRAWLYSLDGRWFQCRVMRVSQGPLWIFDPAEPILGGMSGSPIRADDGSVISLVSRSSAVIDHQHHVVIDRLNEQCPQPVLTRNLPARLRDDLLASYFKSMINSENIRTLARQIDAVVSSLIDQGLAWPIYGTVVASNGAIAGLHYLDQDSPGHPVAHYCPNGVFSHPIRVFLTDGVKTAWLTIRESDQDTLRLELLH